jgi:chromosome segregation ATPase
MAVDSAAKALSELDNVLADSQRRLGKKGKMPKAKPDPHASLTKCVAAAKALEDEVKKLAKALKTYQETLSDVEAECDDYSTLISKSDFDLGSDEETINKLRYNLTKCLKDICLGSKTPRREAAKILDALNGADLTTF